MRGILPTTFNGIKYRSRTEARWAVFLSVLDIPFDYECEGYRLDGFYYLPDFYLPDQGVFMEIKGEAPTLDESSKASMLAEFTKKDVFIFWGVPRKPWSENGTLSDSASLFPKEGGQDFQHWWCECPKCHKLDIQFNGRADRIRCRCPKELGKDYRHDTPRLTAAYEAAEKYEFWNPGVRQ